MPELEDSYHVLPNTLLIRFSLNHEDDWTRMTRGYRAKFESLYWQPVDETANFEVLLAGWKDRTHSILDFITRLKQRGKIYKVLSFQRLEPISKLN